MDQPPSGARNVEPIARHIPQIEYGASSVQGKRDAMEDAHQVIQDLTAFANRFGGKKLSYFAVFDGHTGDKVATYAATRLHLNLILDRFFSSNIEEALRNAFAKTDKEFLATERNDGSTAIVAVIEGNMLYIANLGDSRAVLEKNGEVEFATEDHKPNHPKEKARIEAAGGFVKNGRVSGRLAVSRAFGDKTYKILGGKIKAPLVSNVPTISRKQLTPQNKFLILASDGLWDVMTNQEAVDLVHKKLKQHQNPQKASKALVTRALKEGSKDNITALVVSLVETKKKRRRIFGKSLGSQS